MAASRASWPLARGLRPLVRISRRRDASVRADAVPRQSLRTAARAARGRLPPQRRPRRSRDRIRRRPPGRRRRAPVLLLLRDGRVPLAAPRSARSGSSDTAASSTRAGTRGARPRSRGSVAAGIVLRRHRALAPTALGPGVGFARRTTNARSRRDSWSASRRTSRTPTRRSDASSSSSPRPATSTTPSSSPSPTTARARRADPRGSINDGRLVNGDPAGRRELLGAHRRDRRPDGAQQLPVGLDDGRQHAVQALEARGPRRRRRRPVHRARACTSSDRAKCAGSSRTRSTSLPTMLDLAGMTAARDPRRHRAVTDRRRELGVGAGDGTHRPRATTQYFEMLGSRGIYHDGWKAVTFHPLGAMYDDGLDPDAPFADDVWELYHVEDDIAETHDLAAQEPERLARMIDMWWDEARATTCCRSTTVPCRHHESATAPAAVRARVTRTTRMARRCPSDSAVNVRNRSHTITAYDRASRPASSRAASCSRWAPCSAASRSTSSTACRCYVHNLYGEARDRRFGFRRSRRGRTHDHVHVSRRPRSSVDDASSRRRTRRRCGRRYPTSRR